MASKRKVLSVMDKVAIIKDSEKGLKNIAISKKYGLSSSTVSSLLKNRELLLQAYKRNITASKRLKKCDKADLDEVLYRWYICQKNAGLPTNYNTIKGQAQIFASQLGYEDFFCSNGWLHRFKMRHNIYHLKKKGETVLESVLEPLIHFDSDQSLNNDRSLINVENEESESETSVLSNSTSEFSEINTSVLHADLKMNGINSFETSENTEMEITLLTPVVSISENNLQELDTIVHNDKAIVSNKKGISEPLNNSLLSLTTDRQEKEIASVDCHIDTEMLLDKVKQENESGDSNNYAAARTQLLPLHFYSMATHCVETLQCFFESIDQNDKEVFDALGVIRHKLSSVKHPNKTSSDNR